MSWGTFSKIAPLLAILLLLGLAINEVSFLQSQTEQGSQSASASEPLCVFKGGIGKNESLYSCLIDEGVPPGTAHEITKALAQVFNVKKSLPGDEFTLLLNRFNSPVYLEYKRGVEERYIVESNQGKLSARAEPAEFTRLVKGLSGTIENSLWESMISSCRDPELILSFADIFAWEIDFLTEIRNGDRFRLMVEELWKEGKFVRYGDILAAEYVQSQDTYTAILYRQSPGHKDYFDLTGASLRKTLLRSPLHYRRISSGFSYSRFHPILRRRQPHYGVDYAAPVGTPVSAAGDGVIIFAGWNQGLGRILKIKHPRGFITSYGHLKGFASGIKKGTRVKQKEVIGYVGQTGIATGSHLDYRCQKDGRYVNPLRMIVPSVEPLEKELLDDFGIYSRELLCCMDFLCQEKVLASAE